LNTRTVLPIIFLLAFASCFACAKSYEFSDVFVNYTVAPDGVISVSEQLTFDFSGSYSFAYRDLESGAWTYDAVTVSERLADGSIAPVHATTSFEGSATRYRWEFSASNEKKTFIISYTLRNAIVSYADGLELYWKAWDSQWAAPVRHLSGEVHFPKPLYSGSQVWLHPDLDATYNLTGSLLVFEARSIPKNTFLEFRVLFNKEPLDSQLSQGNVITNSGSGVEAVKEEEQRFAVIASQNEQSRSVVSSIALPFAILSGILLCACYAYAYYTYGVEKKRYRIASSQDIPEPELAPWQAEYAVTHRVTDKSMAATVLDLARKGVITIEKVKKQGMWLFSGEDYKISRTKSKASLDGFESLLLEEIFKPAPEGLLDGIFGKKSRRAESDGVTLSEVAAAHQSDSTSMLQKWVALAQEKTDGPKGLCAKYFDQTGARVFYWLASIVLALCSGFAFASSFLVSGQAWTAVPTILAAVFAASAVCAFWATPSANEQQGTVRQRWAFGANLVLLLFAAFACAFSTLVYGMLLLLAVSFVALMLSLYDYAKPFALPRFSEEGEKVHVEWMGLKRFLDEMDNFRSKLPTEIALWEQYLVYATAFGNADKVEAAMSKLKVVPSHYHGFAYVAMSPAFSSSFHSSFSAASAASVSGSASGGGGGGGGAG